VPIPRFQSITAQVAAHLREELVRGRWSGTMPGVPALAEELGIAKKTVDLALRLLEKQGLLVPQGAGRRRKIVLPEGGVDAPTLRVGLLLFESKDRGEDFMIELRHLLEEAGHVPFYSDKGLVELGMDVRRVARHVKKTEADAWIVFAASQEVLEWFSARETPAFAVSGRQGGLPIAGTRVDKAPVFAEITRRLITLGHSAITCVIRRQHRLPQPARSPRAFLGELEGAGIVTGAFNLPDWEESREGFGKLLDSLFRTTPPTALILDEPFLYHAAHHHLAKRGLQVPGDVSLICTDADPGFAWCDPSVAHIRWDHRPMQRRVVRWANNVARGKDDRQQTLTKAEFVEGGTVGRAPGR
jgi:hypothetical protein